MVVLLFVICTQLNYKKLKAFLYALSFWRPFIYIDEGSSYKEDVLNQTGCTSPKDACQGDSPNIEDGPTITALRINYHFWLLPHSKCRRIFLSKRAM